MLNRRNEYGLRQEFGDAFIDGYGRALAREGVTVMVVQDPSKDELPTEIIAQEIAAIADGMRRIEAGKLNRAAVLLLLSDASGLGKKQVKQVLDAMAELRDTYLKS